MAVVVLTGAHVQLLVNGQLLGRVTKFRWSRRVSRRRLQAIDQQTASELVPGAIVVQGAIELIHTQDDGGAEGAGLIAPVPDLQREQYLTLELRDYASDTVVFSATQCMIDSESWEAQPKQVLAGSLTFEGLTLATAVRPRDA